MCVLSSVSQSACNTSFSFANILSCVRGLYLQYINRSASAPLESCTACATRSAASSVSITRIRCKCRSLCWISSMAVISSGYLSPLLNLKYYSCHFVFSPRKTGGFLTLRPRGSLRAASQLLLQPRLALGGVSGLVPSALQFYVASPTHPRTDSML